MRDRPRPDGPPALRLGIALRRRWIVVSVLLVNLAGIAYGFYYYQPQFRATPWWLWPLVPDSPMAVLLASSALVLLLVGRDHPVWNAIAMGAMVKVGVWTAVVLAWFPDHFGFRLFPSGLDCSGTGFGFRCADLNTYLFYLHLAMAAQALVLAGRFPTRPAVYVALAAVFVAVDAVDYNLPVDHMGRGCDGVFPYTVPCDHHGATFGVTALLSALSLLALWLLQRATRRRAA